MRNYWIKIAAGALGIFAVGMIVITGLRAVKSKVTTTLNSNDPIPIPLIGLVPFRVDSAKLGSVTRVEFLRSDPEHVSGVRVLVKLADSIAQDRLHNCTLAIQSLDKIDERTSFSCRASDAAPADLQPFGTVVVRRIGGSDTLALLLPGKAVGELQGTRIRINGHGIQISGPEDPIADVLEARTDSIHEMLDQRIDARSDSVDELKDLAGTLEDSAAHLSTGARRRVQASGDSVRAVMRAMVDRMQADQMRMDALEHVTGLSVAERDSLANLGPAMHDSIQSQVARELVRMRADLEKELPEAPAAHRGLPAVPTPPKPAASARVN
jgi:hypothetical protein